MVPMTWMMTGVPPEIPRSKRLPLLSGGDEGRTAPRWSSGRLLLVCSSMIYSLSIYLINLYLDDSVLNAMFEGLIYM